MNKGAYKGIENTGLSSQNGDWLTWEPTSTTGFASITSSYYRYKLVGKIVFIDLMVVGTGTGNFLRIFGWPRVNSFNPMGAAFVNEPFLTTYCTNNGVGQSNYGCSLFSIAGGSGTDGAIFCYPTPGGGNFSGDRAVQIHGWYSTF